MLHQITWRQLVWITTKEGIRGLLIVAVLVLVYITCLKWKYLNNSNHTRNANNIQAIRTYIFQASMLQSQIPSSANNVKPKRAFRHKSYGLVQISLRKTLISTILIAEIWGQQCCILSQWVSLSEETLRLCLDGWYSHSASWIYYTSIRVFTAKFLKEMRMITANVWKQLSTAFLTREIFWRTR